MYKKENLGSYKSETIDFSHEANQSAYLYNFAPLHTAVMAIYLNTLRTNEYCKQHIYKWYAETTSKSCEYMKICALGGGPSLELACIYLWLEDLHAEYQILHSTLCNTSQKSVIRFLDMFLIDLNIGWIKVCADIYNAFQSSAVHSPSIFGASIEYVECDLLRSYRNERAKKAIRQADFIVMMKLLSAVASRENEEQCLSMLQSLMASMKPGALFMVVDGSCELIKRLVNSAIMSNNMHTIFQSDKMFELQEQSTIQWQRDYANLFAMSKPMTSCKIFVKVIQKPYLPSTFQGGIPVGLSVTAKPLQSAMSSGKAYNRPGRTQGEQRHNIRNYSDWPSYRDNHGRPHQSDFESRRGHSPRYSNEPERPRVYVDSDNEEQCIIL